MTQEKVSLSVRRAWIEMYSPIDLRYSQTSLSVRRAWIEINTETPHTYII